MDLQLSSVISPENQNGSVTLTNTMLNFQILRRKAILKKKKTVLLPSSIQMGCAMGQANQNNKRLGF